MTSETPDMLYPITVEEKELELLKIASIQKLKRGNKKCGNEEVFNLVKDSVDDVIKKEIFNNLLDILFQKQSIKRNKIGNRNACPFLKTLYDKLTSDQKSVNCSQALYNPVSQLKIQAKQLLKHYVGKQSFNQTLKVF